MRASRLRAPRPRPVGQTLVEFALVLPIFLVMLFGVIDGGRIVYMNTILSQAAREAARVGAVEASHIGTASSDPSCNTPGGPVCPASVAALEADVLAAANREVAPFGPIQSARLYLRCDSPGSAPTGSWTGQSCSASSPNDLVSVRVELQFTAVTPIAGPLLPPAWLSGAATMVIN
jgi:hypothetical protein